MQGHGNISGKIWFLNRGNEYSLSRAPSSGHSCIEGDKNVIHVPVYCGRAVYRKRAVLIRDRADGWKNRIDMLFSSMPKHITSQLKHVYQAHEGIIIILQTWITGI